MKPRDVYRWLTSPVAHNHMANHSATRIAAPRATPASQRNGRRNSGRRNGAGPEFTSAVPTTPSSYPIQGGAALPPHDCVAVLLCDRPLPSAVSRGHVCDWRRTASLQQRRAAWPPTSAWSGVRMTFSACRPCSGVTLGLFVTLERYGQHGYGGARGPVHAALRCPLRRSVPLRRASR